MNLHLLRITVIYELESMILEVIILGAHFLTVSTAPVVPGQIGCAEGEPAVGRFEIKVT